TDVPTTGQAATIRLWTYGASALLGLVSLGAMALSFYRIRRTRPPWLDGLHLSLWIVLMLLVLPTSWMHYETQLLLPLGALLAYALITRQRWLLLLWASAAALTAFGNQEIFRGGDFDAWPLSLVQSYKLYGLLLLWVSLLWVVLRPRLDPPRD